MSTRRSEWWARQEFGDAELGDDRRRQRLIQMGAEMASNPSGQLTGSFLRSAEREGAYRFIENDSIAPSEIGRSAYGAAAKRCFGQEFVFVPVDGSSLNLRDAKRRRGMGTIGTHGAGAQGMEVMSAIVVSREGTPTGICGQRYWTRHGLVGIGRHDYDTRSVEQKETQHWLHVIADVSEVFALEAPGTRPWFQLDRGGDAWPVLVDAIDTQRLVTIRAAQNRRLVGKFRGKRDYLWNCFERQEPQASYVLSVPSGEGRERRLACVQVQFAPVVLDVRDRRNKKSHAVRLWAVRVVELDGVARGADRIEWLLLTTHPVENLADAKLVIDGYTSRWRIEEFHKTWKSGACNVEDTRLQRRSHIERFAVISASVAMRVQRLTHLSRSAPDLAATEAFSRAEIDAAILLHKPRGYRRGATPTLAEVVHWIADIGGFMGPSASKIRKAQDPSKLRRPGAIVIARGLARVEPVARILEEGVEM